MSHRCLADQLLSLYDKHTLYTLTHSEYTHILTQLTHSVGGDYCVECIYAHTRHIKYTSVKIDTCIKSGISIKSGIVECIKGDTRIKNELIDTMINALHEVIDHTRNRNRRDIHSDISNNACVSILCTDESLLMRILSLIDPFLSSYITDSLSFFYFSTLFPSLLYSCDFSTLKFHWIKSISMHKTLVHRSKSVLYQCIKNPLYSTNERPYKLIYHLNSIGSIKAREMEHILSIITTRERSISNSRDIISNTHSGISNSDNISNSASISNIPVSYAVTLVILLFLSHRHTLSFMRTHGVFYASVFSYAKSISTQKWSSEIELESKYLLYKLFIISPSNFKTSVENGNYIKRHKHTEET